MLARLFKLPDGNKLSHCKSRSTSKHCHSNFFTLTCHGNFGFTDVFDIMTFYQAMCATHSIYEYVSKYKLL